MTIRTWLAAGLLALSPGAFGAGSADDDLAIVKKAVSESSARPAASAVGAEREGVTARQDGRAPRWLKVRVHERSGKRVSINLPLSLARAVGDIPIDYDCGSHRCRLTVGDVLRSLDGGEDIVQVDSEKATVRVWLE